MPARDLLWLAAAGLCGGCVGIAGLGELSFEADGGSEAAGGNAMGGQAPGGGGAGASEGGAGAAGGGAGGGGTEAGCGGADLMSDPDNCGACDVSCAGGECVAGKCAPTLLAGDQMDAHSIAVVDGMVYWVNHSSGQVWKCPTTGCDQQPTQLAEVGSGCFYLAADGTNLFWNRNDGDAIYRCPVGGCLGNETIIASPLDPTRVSIDATHVYWHSNNQRISRVPKAGGGVEDLALGEGNSGAVVSDGVTVYWTNQDIPAIRQCSINNCAPSTVATLTFKAHALELDADNLYYGTHAPTANHIGYVPRGGGSAVTLSFGYTNVADIALSETHAYFVNRTTIGGGAHRVPKAGGSVIEYSWSWANPSAIAYADGFVYVADSDSGEIVRFSAE